MLGSLQILLLVCGFLSGAGESDRLLAQPNGSCWLRTDCLVLNRGTGAIRWPVAAASRQLDDLLQVLSAEPVAHDNSMPPANGRAIHQFLSLTRLSRTLAAGLTASGEAGAKLVSWGFDIISRAGMEWEQLYCARVAASADLAEQRVAQYWDYYAAWDRWLPGATLSRNPSAAASADAASRWVTPLDRQLAFVANKLPILFGQATAQFAQTVTHGLDRSAQALLKSQDQLASLQLGRWLRTSLKTANEWRAVVADRLMLAPGWIQPRRASLRVSVGVAMVCRQVEHGVVGLGRGVEVAVAASVDVLGWIPVEAIGQVWPD